MRRDRTAGKTAPRRRRRRIAAAGVAAALVITVPSAGRSAPDAPGRTDAAVGAPQVLAPVAMASSNGVTTGPDGTIYATEGSRDRVMAQHPDGSVEVLTFGGIDGPSSIAAADDGRLAIATSSAIVIVDGADRTDLPIPLRASVDGLAFDSAGLLYLTDSDASRVLRRGADGQWSEVDLGSTGTIRGLSIDADDSIYVLDEENGNVVQRDAAGTVTPISVTGLDDPLALSVAGGRIAIAQRGAVIVRETDGSQSSPAGFAAEDPHGIHLDADGTLLLAFTPDMGGRTPGEVGAVLRLVDGGSIERLTFGDLYAFGSVAAAQPATVLFTSWSGIPGYSDPNPVRRTTGGGAPEDVLAADSTGMLLAAADDGTLYRTQGQHGLVRIAPDGTTTDVPLPTEPGIDSVFGLSVDDDGSLFVALGSGYGSGGFKVVEPLAAGGSKTWFESDGSTETLQAMAAGGGTVQLLTFTRDGAHLVLSQLQEDGTLTARADLGGTPIGLLAIDAAGNAFVTGDGTITRVAADGTETPFSYDGMGHPTAISFGPDGTLYVGDDRLGLVMITGVGGEPIAPDGPPAAVPATPVSGDPSFTG